MSSTAEGRSWMEVISVVVSKLDYGEYENVENVEKGENVENGEYV